jgi:hypothetical protein
MNDLSGRARTIVDRARDSDEPSSADGDRIKRAILLQIAIGGMASTATAGTLSLGAKVGVAVLAALLVGGAGVGLVNLHRTHSTAEREAYVPAKMALPRQAPAVHSQVSETTEPETTQPTMVAPTPDESEMRMKEKPRKSGGTIGREEKRTAEEDRLNAEVAVLKRAREELRLGRPAQALKLLIEYDRRFGKGMLGQERQAMAAIAACQAQPGPGAQAQAEAFIRTTPSSPLIDRVRATCITSPLTNLP